jgi:hypothetical protein
MTFVDNKSQQLSFETLAGVPLACMFLVFALTPWVSWGTNDLDSQPWTLLSGGLYLVLMLRVISIPKRLLAALAILVCAIVASVLVKPPEQLFFILRGIANYATLGVALLVAYDIYLRFGFPERLIIVINLVWWAALAVERVAPALLALIRSYRTSEGRGLTSLAPEPTFFAIFLVFLSWIMLIGASYRPRLIHWMLLTGNLVCIVLMAKSTMGLLYVLIALVALGIYLVLSGKVSPKLAIGVIASATLVVITANMIVHFGILQGTRLFGVMETLTSTSPVDLVYKDESMNGRVEHVVIPLHGVFRNFFLPGGFDGYAETRNALIGFYNGYFWAAGNEAKIMSWIGAFVFELGAGALLFLFVVFRPLFAGSLQERCEAGLLLVLLLGSVPIAFAPVSMIIAAMYARRYLQQPATDMAPSTLYR